MFLQESSEKIYSSAYVPNCDPVGAASSNLLPPALYHDLCIHEELTKKHSEEVSRLIHSKRNSSKQGTLLQKKKVPQTSSTAIPTIYRDAAILPSAPRTRVETNTESMPHHVQKLLSNIRSLNNKVHSDQLSKNRESSLNNPSGLRSDDTSPYQTRVPEFFSGSLNLKTSHAGSVNQLKRIIAKKKLRENKVQRGAVVVFEHRYLRE